MQRGAFPLLPCGRRYQKLLSLVWQVGRHIPSKSLAGVCLADMVRQDAELESNETLHQLFKEIWLPHAEVRHLLYARMPVLFESDKMQNMQKGKSQKNLTHVQ